MYTIGQISKMFNIPISTLRYYDNEGLFPHIKRESNIRIFSDNEIEALRVIECLKKAGLEIKDIKEFMNLCKLGPSTYTQRKELLEKERTNLKLKIDNLNKSLDMLNFKCWYYDVAIQDGNEDNLKKMIPNNLPDEIKDAYNNSHN